jgi:hypothetical protein
MKAPWPLQKTVKDTADAATAEKRLNKQRQTRKTQTGNIFPPSAG